MLIDTHAHLLHPRFADLTEAVPDAEPRPFPRTPADLVVAAKAVGVGQMVTIACRRDEWAPALAVAQAHPEVAVAVGIHPQDVAEEPLVTVDELVEAARLAPVVGIGETGLDYYYENTPRALQRASFERHLQAARQAKLPVVVHTRDAEDDTLAVLNAFTGVPFILHCFTGSDRLAEACVALGGYVSFSGIFTFKKAQNLRNLAARLPRDRVLLETDAPYLAPDPHRGKLNAPHLLPHTAAVLAQVWQESPSTVMETTTANARRVFSRLPDPTEAF